MRKTARNLGCLGAAFVVAVLAAQPALAAKKVLRLTFHGPLLESPMPELDFGFIFSGQQKPHTLYEMTSTIRKAAKDKSIDALLVIVDQPEMNFAQLEELHRTLGEFRASGKKVYAYLDYGTNLTYALASAADHITLADYSDLDITGLNATLVYFKKLFDKIGVEADMLHCGAYKSAGETFSREAPSEEAAENINWLLDGIYERWLAVMAEGRKLSIDQVRAAVDRAPLTSKEALELKLVDAIASFGDFRQMIKKEYGKDVSVVKSLKKEDDFDLDMSNPFAMFSLFNKLMDTATEETKPGVAVIYVEGGIVPGRSENDPFSGQTAGSTTLRAALEKARTDDNVKAVVLRVDSPGGSALASDIIWEAATRCAKEKPLIVSMGGVAGSGGYYVSLPGDTIFAEAATITGSIGVVGGKLISRELMHEKLGITTAQFARGKYAALMTSMRKWNDDERARITKLLDDVYSQFKGRVTESRGDRIKGDLEKLAGGRVYTGKQALERGLVDRIGGLNDAIAFAGDKVGLKDPTVIVLPKQKDFLDILKEAVGADTEDEYEIRSDSPLAGALRGQATWLSALLPVVHELTPELRRPIQTGLRQALQLNREHVELIAPLVPSIR